MSEDTYRADLADCLKQLLRDALADSPVNTDSAIKHVYRRRGVDSLDQLEEGELVRLVEWCELAGPTQIRHRLAVRYAEWVDANRAWRATLAGATEDQPWPAGLRERVHARYVDALKAELGVVSCHQIEPEQFDAEVARLAEQGLDRVQMWAEPRAEDGELDDEPEPVVVEAREPRRARAEVVEDAEVEPVDYSESDQWKAANRRFWGVLRAEGKARASQYREWVKSVKGWSSWRHASPAEIGRVVTHLEGLSDEERAEHVASKALAWVEEHGEQERQ